MAKYQAGDKVSIRGDEWTLGSWPENDEGWFTAMRMIGDAENYGTFMTGMVEKPAYDAHGGIVTVQQGGVGEPVATPAAVELVAKGKGVQSTAGDLADLTAEAEDAVDAVEAKDAAESK